MNVILNTDSYKSSHFEQFPPNATHTHYYIESRGGDFDKTVFFGLQVLLKNLAKNPITRRNVAESHSILEAHGLPFNREGWLHIVEAHGGKLPIEVRAPKEGLVIPTKNILCTITNTDPKCAWLPGYLETMFLRAVWYPTTVATYSYHVKQVILKYLELNGTPKDIDFKLHDFGARGATSEEAAMLGGMGHLVNFQGTDTLSAIMGARKYYDCAMAGHSITATEHSSVTSWGQENEKEAYFNLLDKNKGKTVACVSDSYNIWEALKMWKELESKIIEDRITLVIRPDSGDPVSTPIRVVRECMDLFGYEINSKGYKVLPDHIRVIQGDGVDIESIEQILAALNDVNISSDNIAFGMGGALLQKHDRDTLKFAMKCSHINFADGTSRDVFKNPITDKGKASKKGKLALYRTKDGYVTKAPNAIWTDYLEERIDRIVFENGRLVEDNTLSEIRNNACK